MRKACLEAVYQLAKSDPRVVFIGSDLGVGTLQDFKRDIPDRFFMEGISEAHIIGMAAGLAMTGHVVYVNTIATFLTRRCYEQIAVDLGIHGPLPVRLLGTGGGMVYAPLGPTHEATDDLALMRAVPNMAVVAPADAGEMRRVMAASLAHEGPMYIRMAKGGDPTVIPCTGPFRVGPAVPLRNGTDALIVTTGIAAAVGLEAAALLAPLGVDAGVLHVPTVKPLDAVTLLDRARGVRIIVTIEEHSVVGGLGSAVAECVAETAWPRPVIVRRIGLPDVYPDRYGTQQSLMERYGITAARVVEEVTALLGGGRPAAGRALQGG